MIPVEEGMLSLVDASPAIGADFLRDGTRVSWIDDGFDMGSQGVHLATNADAAQEVRVDLEVIEEDRDPQDDEWEFILEGSALWPVGNLILESADLERRPMAQVSPGQYRLKVWAKDLDKWRASYDEWQRRVVEWSDTGRDGPLPAPGPSPEIWLIQAWIS